MSRFYVKLQEAAEDASTSEAQRFFPTVPDRDNRLLTGLVNLELPGLASLSPEDMIATRQGDAFN